ncbi:FUSC family protein, partial [Streptomyces sp. NPDC127079]
GGAPALVPGGAGADRGGPAAPAHPEASHDARLAAACWRVEAAVEALTRGSEHITAPAEPPTEPALAHLHGLERALVDLAEPLRTPPGSPLVGA